MKKYITLSIFYAVLAMAAGIFYREFTKFFHFTQCTTLSTVHVHLFALGMIFVLLIGLYRDKLDSKQNKLYTTSFLVYNVFLLFMALMLLIKGILQVNGSSIPMLLTIGSGISHTGLGISMILVLLSLLKSSKQNS